MADASEEPAPRDAATLVIVDESRSGRSVLLGKRRQTQVFAPGKYVFPGGSVDAADSLMPPCGQLRDSERIPLLHDLKPVSNAAVPETFALAAIRETFEETGLLIGTRTRHARAVPKSWQGFVELGCQPRLAGLSFIARAITPPGRSRRFDARFFLALAADIAVQTNATDGEFEELRWVSFAAAYDLDLHGVTRSVLEEAERYLGLSAHGRSVAGVPYYFATGHGWQRDVIARRPPSAVATVRT